MYEVIKKTTTTTFEKKLKRDFYLDFLLVEKLCKIYFFFALLHSLLSKITNNFKVDIICIDRFGVEAPTNFSADRIRLNNINNNNNK